VGSNSTFIIVILIVIINLDCDHHTDIHDDIHYNGAEFLPTMKP
jgi:hypothetical protein